MSYYTNMKSEVLKIAHKHNCSFVYYPAGSNNCKILGSQKSPTIVYSECFQYCSNMTPNMQPLLLVEVFVTDTWDCPFGYRCGFEMFLETKKDLERFEKKLTDMFLPYGCDFRQISSPAPTKYKYWNCNIA